MNFIDESDKQSKIYIFLLRIKDNIIHLKLCPKIHQDNDKNLEKFYHEFRTPNRKN